MSVFVGILAIFRRDIGAKYWGTFKKAWGCVGKKVTLQKCETNFKEDIKNSLLSRFVVRRPKLVKPLSVGIEILAVLVVLITVWSLVEAAKAGLSLWVFGTCNVSRPSACLITDEVCAIDNPAPQNFAEGVGRWFTEWGEIFTGIPDRVRRWDARLYVPQNATYWSYEADRPTALVIFDVGCINCLASFRNKQRGGFFERYNVTHIPYVILNPTDQEDRFPNSRLVSSYIVALRLSGIVSADGNPVPLDWRVIEQMFTEQDENGVNYQEAIKRLEPHEVKILLESWLFTFGLAPEEVSRIRRAALGEEVADTLLIYRDIVENRINAKGIPTTIFGGRRHMGLYD